MSAMAFQLNADFPLVMERSSKGFATMTIEVRTCEGIVPRGSRAAPAIGIQLVDEAGD